MSLSVRGSFVCLFGWLVGVVVCVCSFLHGECVCVCWFLCFSQFHYYVFSILYFWFCIISYYIYSILAYQPTPSHRIYTAFPLCRPCFCLLCLFCLCVFLLTLSILRSNVPLLFHVNPLSYHSHLLPILSILSILFVLSIPSCPINPIDLISSLVCPYRMLLLDIIPWVSPSWPPGRMR